MAFNSLSFINRIFSGKTKESNIERRQESHAKPKEATTKSARGIMPTPNNQLNYLEIEFLARIDGKRANDASVLGWWCEFHNLNREQLIKKLTEQGYIALADYKVSVQKATAPALKEILKKYDHSTKGKKSDLVERVLERISQDECQRYFTESYWAITPKTTEVFKFAELNAKEEGGRVLVLIREGKYAEFKRRMYPNRNQHWGTEDTFCETVGLVMRHCFHGFGLHEAVRRNSASFVARRAVDYNSRGYSSCMAEIIAYLRSANVDPLALTIPDSLKIYADTNSITLLEDVLEVYTTFVINKAQQTAELNNFKRLGFKTVLLDSAACDVCGRKKRQKKYGINEAPSLPVGWGCACTYSI
jgi:hypothetical protein